MKRKILIAIGVLVILAISGFWWVTLCNAAEGANMLSAEEYDGSYFDGKSQVMMHNAGYSKYERLYQNNGPDSLGEFWKDQAAGYINNLVLSGKTVLEIGCAKGFVVQSLRELGVDAWGIDVSPYAIGEATAWVAPFLTVADARTHLATYSNNQWDVLFSLRTLECFTDAELALLIPEMNRVSKRQFHQIDEFIGYPSKTGASQFYNAKTLEDWLLLPFSKNTKLISREDDTKILSK